VLRPSVDPIVGLGLSDTLARSAASDDNVA
jgi:hypothetical protein